MSEPKYRRPLNTEQIDLLKLLYRFRFGSSDLIADYFGKSDGVFVYKRLKILQEQGFIGKRFDSSYRLRGRSAAYYLLPAGARELQRVRSDKAGAEINVKAVYKDGSVSEGFVDHCLGIFAVYNEFRRRYGSVAKFFTKSGLGQYEYFPQPLPDAYIRLTDGDGDRHFFLDMYDDVQPFFAAARRVKQYIDYSEGGDWEVTNVDLPVILAVCESETLRKRLVKKIGNSLRGSWSEEVVFGVTTRAALLSGEGAIWQRGNDPEEVVELESLS